MHVYVPTPYKYSHVYRQWKEVWIWCMFVRASLYKRREENQLDATKCFIALIICSTCFVHLYSHHQELETPLFCDCSSSFPYPWRITCCSAPNSRPPATKALHTICGNNTSTVSSSWWWAYKCPKHVEQIISAIKHSVASSWFSSLRLEIWISVGKARWPLSTAVYHSV